MQVQSSLHRVYWRGDSVCRARLSTPGTCLNTERLNLQGQCHRWPLRKTPPVYHYSSIRGMCREGVGTKDCVCFLWASTHRESCESSAWLYSTECDKDRGEPCRLRCLLHSKVQASLTLCTSRIFSPEPGLVGPRRLDCRGYPFG